MNEPPTPASLEYAESLRSIHLPSGFRISAPLVGVGSIIEHFIPTSLALLQSNITPAIDTVASRSLTDEAMFPHVLASYPLAAASTQDRSTLSSSVDFHSLFRLLRQPPVRFDAPLLGMLHRTLGFPDAAYRRSLTWVGGTCPGDAWLVPAPTSSIPQLLDDLFAFLSDEQVDARVKLPLAAYQLLHIHPFKDGNGRACRLLVWLLGSRNPDVAIPLCLLLSMRKALLGQALIGVRNGDVAPYLEMTNRASDHWNRLRARHRGCEQALASTFDLHNDRQRLLAHAAAWCGWLDPMLVQRALGCGEGLANKYIASIAQRPGSVAVAGRISFPAIDAERRSLLDLFFAEFDNHTVPETANV